jgi:predicted DNA-binding transcriptional regulator YafY
MLLVLQRRGRMTARELATTLEVSERTILRDVEALGEAGVPIYTSRGSGGGIELMDGFQTRLTGLTADEAACLFLVGQPLVAHRLGLGAPTRAARHKLSAALPAALAEQAEQVSTWFVHDPDPWDGSTVPHGELRRLALAIRQRRRAELHRAQAAALTVSPLGLVLKAGSWHLVVAESSSRGAAGSVVGSVVGLDDLRATRLTSQRFEPPEGFALDAFWTAYLGAGPSAPRRRQA